jgi:transcriptional regulator GlxA family with amidase domain
MHRVAFVVYPGFELLDMSGPAAVFDGANYLLTQAGKPAFYTVDVVSIAGGPIRSRGGVVICLTRVRRLGLEIHEDSAVPVSPGEAA